jgi:hypothetical protein
MSCTRPRAASAAGAAREPWAGGVWPVDDPDEAIAVGYLASYYRRTWIVDRPNSVSANRLLRCLLHGARRVDGP